MSFVETIKKMKWTYPIFIFLSQRIHSARVSIVDFDWSTNQKQVLKISV